MNKMYSEKFKNLVLYVLSHEDYQEGGIKKLNKLLYFIDFYFYRDHERLISGARYAKADMGPIVDGYKTIFNELEKDHFLEMVNGDGFVAYKPVIASDINLFTPEEIDHIGRVLDRYGKLPGIDLEGISHGQQPWLLTENMGDFIDPDLALLMAEDNAEESETVENEGLKTELVNLANAA